MLTEQDLAPPDKLLEALRGLLTCRSGSRKWLLRQRDRRKRALRRRLRIGSRKLGR